MSPVTTLDPLVEGYLAYLAKVGRKAPRTIVDVRCTLHRATLGLNALRPAIALWHLKLEDFLLWLEGERQRGRANTALAKQLSHLRGFLDYAWRSGRAERNVLDGFSLQHTIKRIEPKALDLQEAERLIQAAAAPGQVSRRDRLIILLLYGCGLRTNELCALDVTDINRERQELIVRKAKHDRPRAVPIPAAVYTELLAYLLDHGKRGPLLRTLVKNCRMGARDVGIVVSTISSYAGLRPDVTPRTLRHSFATHLMDQGVDLAVIASLMGHRSPQETGVYLHVLPGKTQVAVRTLPSGGRP